MVSINHEKFEISRKILDIANVLYMQTEYEKALEYYYRSFKECPGNSLALGGCAIVYRRMKNYRLCFINAMKAFSEDVYNVSSLENAIEALLIMNFRDLAETLHSLFKDFAWGESSRKPGTFREIVEKVTKEHNLKISNNKEIIAKKSGLYKECESVLKENIVIPRIFVELDRLFKEHKYHSVKAICRENFLTNKLTVLANFHFLYSKACLQLGDITQAIYHCNTCLKYYIKHSGASLLLDTANCMMARTRDSFSQMCHMETTKDETAGLEAFQDAVQEPMFISYVSYFHFMLGLSNKWLGDYRNAACFFNLAVSLRKPDNFMGLQMRGICHKLTNSSKSANEDFKDAVRVAAGCKDYDIFAAYFSRKYSSEDNKHLTESDNGITQATDLADYFSMVGQWYWCAGSLSDSFFYYCLACFTEPDNPVLFHQAISCLTNGYYHEMEKVVQRRSSRDDIGSYDLVVLESLNNNKKSESSEKTVIDKKLQASLDLLVSFHPDMKSVTNEVGTVNAVKILKPLIIKTGYNYLNMGGKLLKKGLVEEASNHFKAAFKLFKSEPSSSSEIVINIKTEAKVGVEKTFILSFYIEHCAQFMENNKFKEAKALFEKAKNIAPDWETLTMRINECDMLFQLKMMCCTKNGEVEEEKKDDTHNDDKELIDQFVFDNETFSLKIMAENELNDLSDTCDNSPSEDFRDDDSMTDTDVYDEDDDWIDTDSSGENASKYCCKATAAYLDGDEVDSMKYLDLANKLSPDDSDLKAQRKKYEEMFTTYNKAQKYLRSKDYENAHSYFSKGLVLDVRNKCMTSKMSLGLGLIAFQKSDYEPAIKEFTRAIKLGNDFDEAYIARGNCYYRKKVYKKAFLDYQNAFRMNPKRETLLLVKDAKLQFNLHLKKKYN